jgi:hypothetical protein
MKQGQRAMQAAKMRHAIGWIEKSPDPENFIATRDGDNDWCETSHVLANGQFRHPSLSSSCFRSLETSSFPQARPITKLPPAKQNITWEEAGEVSVPKLE